MESTQFHQLESIHVGAEMGFLQKKKKTNSSSSSNGERERGDVQLLLTGFANIQGLEPCAEQLNYKPLAVQIGVLRF